MRAGAVVTAVVGGLVGLLATVMILGGGGALIGYAAAGGDDGFLETATQRFASDRHAITFADIDLNVDRPDAGPIPDLSLAVRVIAESDAEIFLGIADVDAAAAYLADVGRDVLVDLRSGEPPTYDARPGGAPATAPATQDFWEVSSQGSGEVVLEWDATAGDWIGVLMNADGSAGIVVDARAGIDASPLLPVGAGLLLGGLALLGLGILLIVLATRRSDHAIPSLPPAPPSRATWPPHPVRVEATLDEPLSRGLWLVKWFLAIPHLVVLVVLWAGFVVATAVAGIAILFSGRYPRPLFDYTVGVLRWTWRVTYYAFTLGTDRYPPFSLGDEPYPARLDVAYPEELSRGLVLVKWWLLVIPHAIIVGILMGGATVGGGDTSYTTTGLVTILGVVAGGALLFTGRYPQGLFDLLVGLQRWIYRVVAYAALMRDEYPPFRLDSGGSEPRIPPPPPPGPPPAGTQASRTITLPTDVDATAGGFGERS